MHELSIVESLLEVVYQELEKAGVRGRVVKLRVQIGRLSGVSVEAFRIAFELSKLGTALAEAELEIEEPEGFCVCQACGQRTPVEEMVVGCPGCGNAEIRWEGGQELILQSIELEEGSPPSESQE